MSCLDRTVRSLVAVAALGGVATVAPVRAAAEDPPPPVASTESTHEQLLEEGLRRYDAGAYADAVAAWEKIVADRGEERAWSVCYNLGLAYENLGEATRAAERYDAFLRGVAAQPRALAGPIEERRLDAAERLDAIRSTHGVLVVPAALGEGVVVEIDDTASRPAGFAAYLEPGSHTVVLSGPRIVTSRVEVEIEAGKRVELPLPAPAEAAAAGPPSGPPSSAVPAPAQTLASPPVQARAGDHQPHAGFPTQWVVGGAVLTVASFALPLGLGLRASAERDAAEALGRSHPDYPTAVAHFEAARRGYEISYVASAVLGAATIGAVIYGVAGPSRPPELTASVGTDGASLLLRGAY